MCRTGRMAGRSRSGRSALLHFPSFFVAGLRWGFYMRCTDGGNFQEMIVAREGRVPVRAPPFRQLFGLSQQGILAVWARPSMIECDSYC